MTQADDIMKELKRVAEEAVKKITLDVTANLQVEPNQGGTPRDTGWAVANWVPNITTPFRIDASEVGDISARKAEGEKNKAAISISYKLENGPTFASNNVPYILRLNDGSSKQAPRGFVQNAITKAIKVDMRGFKP